MRTPSTMASTSSFRASLLACVEPRTSCRYPFLRTKFCWSQFVPGVQVFSLIPSLLPPVYVGCSKSLTFCCFSGAAGLVPDAKPACMSRLRVPVAI
jgi:hypothetical protein